MKIFPTFLNENCMFSEAHLPSPQIETRTVGRHKFRRYGMLQTVFSFLNFQDKCKLLCKDIFIDTYSSMCTRSRISLSWKLSLPSFTLDLLIFEWEIYTTINLLLSAHTVNVGIQIYVQRCLLTQNYTTSSLICEELRKVPGRHNRWLWHGYDVVLTWKSDRMLKVHHSMWKSTCECYMKIWWYIVRTFVRIVFEMDKQFFVSYPKYTYHTFDFLWWCHPSWTSLTPRKLSCYKRESLCMVNIFSIWYNQLFIYLVVQLNLSCQCKIVVY